MTEHNECTNDDLLKKEDSLKKSLWDRVNDLRRNLRDMHKVTKEDHIKALCEEDTFLADQKLKNGVT